MGGVLQAPAGHSISFVVQIAACPRSAVVLFLDGHETLLLPPLKTSLGNEDLPFSWTSDGSALVVLANESDRPLRFWLQTTDGSTPRPVTPEGLGGRFVTVNHSDYICIQDETGYVQLFPIDGSKPKRVPTFTAEDEVIGGSADSEALYVSANASGVSSQIIKLNITSGRRRTLVTVSPTDGAGVTFVGRPIFSLDEKFYVYDQVRELSVLYLGTGLK